MQMSPGVLMCMSMFLDLIWLVLVLAAVRLTKLTKKQAGVFMSSQRFRCDNSNELQPVPIGSSFLWTVYLVFSTGAVP